MKFCPDMLTDISTLFRKRSLAWKAPLTLLICAICALGASAQGDNKGSIRGTVSDSAHALVVGANVAVTNITTKTKGKATTDAQGEYRLSGLPAGDYKLEISARGFSPVSAETKVAATSETVVNITLKIAATSEVLKVVGERPMIGDTVDGPGKSDYLLSVSSAGSKAELPDSWVSQYIVEIPQKVIEDQGLTNVTSTLQNVAGANNAYPGYYQWDQTSSSTLRGFSVSQTLRNGMWDAQSSGNIGWIDSVDRVEVLKGPAGLEYGTYWGGIGGVINVVTKKPLTTPYYKLSSSGDSYGSWGVRADLSHPISKKWLARTTLNFSDTQLFARNANYEKRDGNLVIQGQITPKDAITVEYERRWQNGGPYSTLPGSVVAANCTDAAGVNHTNCLMSFNATNRWINLYGPISHWTYNAHNAYAVYEHRFTPSWRVRWSGSISRTGRETPQLSATSLSWVTTKNLNGSYSNTTKYTESFGDIHMGPSLTWDTDAMVEGRFKTARLQHVVIAGYRFSKGGYHMNMYKLPSSVPTTSFSDPMNPVWATVDISQAFRYVWGNYWEHNNNVYFNDIVALGSKLRVTGGVNWTPSWKSDGGSSFAASATSPVTTVPTYTHTVSTDSGQAWRIGGLYDFWPGWTVFADYATTFQPQSSNVTQTGETQYFDPLTGSQSELGVKVAVHKRVSLTAAVYKLKLSNMLAPDPDPTRAANGYKAEIASQHSRGFELDGKFRIGQGWDLLTAYANTDARTGYTTSYVIGANLANVSKNTLRVFGTYEFKNGPLKNLKAGGGVYTASRFRSTTAARTTTIYTLPDNTTTNQLYLVLPAYATVEAMVGYTFPKNFKFAMNVKNLFDHQYIATASSYSALYPGQPQLFSFKLDKTF